MSTEGGVPLLSPEEDHVESRTYLLVLAALSIPMASALAQQHEEMEMHMQPGADCMRVSVQSHTNGSKITGDNSQPPARGHSLPRAV